MRSARTGLSLVETLVALCLLSIAIGPIVALLTVPAHQSALSGLAVVAQVVARQAVTELASLPHDRLLAMRGRDVHGLDGVALPAGFPGSLAIEVENADDSGALYAPVLLLTVTVTWNPRANARETGGKIVLKRLVAAGEWGLAQSNASDV